jgi:hypothetical protein
MKILNLVAGVVVFECEANTMKETVEVAVKQGVSLSYADLSGAYLSGADLSGANLRNANLNDANLRGASLNDADLRGASLSGASLNDASLNDADLRNANLNNANLGGADFNGAHFSGAYLNDASLNDADLSEIKADYLAVLSVAKHEVVELYKALMSGRIDGSAYTGECACLVGTIANIRHEDHKSLGINLRPDSSRPAEIWFLNIRKGDTPENNAVSAIVKDWTLEFMENNGIVV